MTKTLSSYATFPELTKGRRFKEKDSSHRNSFERDHDRIIHSLAFRRLEYKTQVFVNHEGDHYRTRLTHSLEVAQIARVISRRMGVQGDLAEAISLAHDLGHTPFGHAGEHALNKMMDNYGGFNHNLQTIKILTELENKYVEFRGLNLSWEVLEGLIKHNGKIDKKNFDDNAYNKILSYDKEYNFEIDKYSSLEAQIAGISDDIAYNNHDIDDGIRASLFELDDLDIVPIIKQEKQEILKKHPNISSYLLRQELIRNIMGIMIDDLVNNSINNIIKYNIKTVEDVRNCKVAIVDFSQAIKDNHAILRGFLYNNMYKHYKVNRMMRKTQIIIEKLFSFFMENPDCLPSKDKAYMTFDSDYEKANYICNFIASMTDRFAIEEYKKISDPEYKV